MARRTRRLLAIRSRSRGRSHVLAALLAGALIAATVAACGGHVSVRRPTPTASLPPTTTQQPAVAAPSGLPPQGLYEECEPVDQDQCAGELTQMGSAGFRLALDYSAWYGNAAQIEAYAREAQADGVELIWPLNDAAWRDPGSARTLISTYARLAPSCGCKTNSGFVRYALGLARSQTATWGYYIGDELAPSQAPAVAALAAQVRQLDPGHELLYVGNGSTNLAATLPPFESIANVVGADAYPIGTSTPIASVAGIAGTVERLSRADRTRPAMVLQAFSWTEYPGEIRTTNPRWPTEAEMQTMRNQALAANPSLILWYSIYDILRSNNPTQHWRELVEAAFAPAPG